MLLWIGLWKKLRIYKVPIDPFRWSCQDFVSLWLALMITWMPRSKNDLKLSHRKQVNAPSNMKLATSLVNFKCQPCGIFEVFSYHQEYKVLNPTIFADNVGLRDIIKKVVSSNCMGMVISDSLILDTGAI